MTQKNNRIPSFTLSFESILPNFDKPSVKKNSLLCVLCTALGYLPCPQTNSSQGHTVAIWTFPFHKISGFVRVILKGNFKQLYRPKVSIF